MDTHCSYLLIMTISIKREFVSCVGPQKCVPEVVPYRNRVSLGAGSRVWQRLNYRLSPVFLSLWGDETALVYHHKCHGKCSQGSWEICQGHHTPHRRRNWQRLSSHCYRPRRMRRLQFHQAPASLSEGNN